MSIPQTPDALADAISFLDEEVRPRGQLIDADVEALREAIDAMAMRGLLGLRVPIEFGGRGLGDRDFRRFQEACARASGIFAFLQTQHQSACAMLSKSDNAELREAMLPEMARGNARCGIAFSQLRRKSANPLLAAEPVEGGFHVNGTAPWVTGLGFFGHCVSAATLPDSTGLFFLHPLGGARGITLSPPMKLAAMEAAQTVSAQFDNYFAGQGSVLFVRPANWIDENDMVNIALQAPFALGCAQAGLDIVAENARRKQIEGISLAHDALLEDLQRCRTEVYSAMDDPPDVARSLRARAWAIDLALRCSAAAVVSSSGAGNAASHPAQRVYREALVFAVSAQTAAVMESTLERLIR